MHNVTAVRDASPHVRSLLQGRILSRLFREQVLDHLGKAHASHAADRMVLKGGMAMRVAHDSIRHTKDIDLDADHDLGLPCVQAAVRKSIKEALAGNWLTQIQVTEPKQTGTVARWKIQGTVPETGAVLHLTVEVSFRHRLQAGETVHVPYGESPSTTSPVQVYRDEVLLLNKVEAFLSPTRDAPRDVVDMFLLFKGGVTVAPACLAARLGQINPQATIQQIWAKLEAMDEARFRTEILPHWDVAQVPVEWQDWAEIRLLVGERLEAMVRDLASDAPPPAAVSAVPLHRSTCRR